jgi:hypothetical protein
MLLQELHEYLDKVGDVDEIFEYLFDKYPEEEPEILQDNSERMAEILQILIAERL